MKPGGKRRIIIPPELGPPVSLSNLCFHFSLPLSCAGLSNPLLGKKTAFLVLELF